MLTEIVFSYAGVGYLLYNAVEGLDYPLIQGLLLIITAGVLAANLIVDLVYVLLDPTVRKAMTRSAAVLRPTDRTLGAVGDASPLARRRPWAPRSSSVLCCLDCSPLLSRPVTRFSHGRSREPGPLAQVPVRHDGTRNDVFAQVVWGARNSLAVGFLTGSIITVIGVTVGLTAAFFGRWVDYLLTLSRMSSLVSRGFRCSW